MAIMAADGEGSGSAAGGEDPGSIGADTGLPGGSDEEGLGDILVQLSFTVQVILGQAAAEHGLSVIQIRLLGILRDREPTMAALARFLVLDKSSITGLVDRAERRGLVQRAAAPRDGRSIQVAITQHGRDVFNAFAEDAGRGIRALTGGLTEAEGHQLAVLAGSIVRRDAAARGARPAR
jgi:DNA-binding MarR family transcriptional regulator